MNTDLTYAINQLKPILGKPPLSRMALEDRVQRALDALERIADAELLKDLGPLDSGTECTSENNKQDGSVYHCRSFTCPVHGPRNRGIIT